MLAGDVAAAVAPVALDFNLAPATTATTDQPAGELQSRAIVFLDSKVQDLAQLAGAIESGCDLVMLDPDRPGLQQITEVLAGRRDVPAIHLVGHGQAGRLQLGSQVIDQDAVDAAGNQLQLWARSLDGHADILIYGCQTGSGQVGAKFIATIARCTGADVAASIDRTGHAIDGSADWDLERHVGTIESKLAFGESITRHYQHHLPITIEAAGVENTEQMQVLVGGELIATFDNIGGDAYAGVFETYTVDVDGASIDDIRIQFTNDFFDQVGGIDRNLRIDKINVDGTAYETESPIVFSTGTWKAEDGVIPGFRESEFLHTDGYFDYASGTSGTGSMIALTASGSTGEETLALQIDGQTVEVFENISTVGETLAYQADETVTPEQVRVAFTNDAIDPVTGADRNLTVDSVLIDGVTYETEAPTVFSTGTWKPADGLVSGFRESETLHANGFFQYGQADPDPDPELGTIVISAAGTTGSETIELQIDQNTVATFESIGADAGIRAFRDFTYQAGEIIAPNRIRVAFTNDLFDEATGTDRNVVIDQIRVDGVSYETEAPDVFSTGTWLPADGIVAGFRESETLHANGYFQYAAQSTNAGFVGLSATQLTVNEDDGVVQFSVTRYDGSEGPAQVFYQTVAGEAQQGEDFLGTDSGLIEFVDGQTTATGTIDLVDDGVLESIENFSISLFRAEGAELGVPRTAIVTIVDDEAGRDLIASWSLDESSLAVPVSDVSENENDGVFQNFIAGEPGSGPTADAPGVLSPNPGSIAFDGVDDFIAVASDPSLDLSTTLNEAAFTQSVWVRPTGDGTDYQGVVGYQGSGGVSDRYPGIWVYDRDRVHAGFGDGTNWNSFTTDSVLTPDNWNHVATTFDGTTYRAFVNGTLVLSTDDFAGRSPTNTDQVDIGRIDNYFEGGIDDVQIYNRALSGQEINVLIDGADLPDIPVNGQFVTNQLYENFDTPLAVDWLPDGRMLVSEQGGYVRVIDSDGTRQSTPLLDIADRVNAGTKDRGMLGFAIHPDFETNPYIYVSYTYDPPEVTSGSGLGGIDGNGARVARISRFTVSADGTFADPDSEFVLVGNASTYDNIGNPNIRPGLSDPHSCIDENGNPIEDCIPADETSHTIGDLEFGPDGMLYASSGDGGSFGRVDPVNLRALDIDSLAGKILRIDPISGQGPTDNPFYDGDPDSNASKVYQYGLRNPFRIAINQETGGVYNGDVGWTQWEEINTGRGANFGWPAFEGGDGESLQTRAYRDLQQVQDYYANNPDVTAPIWARLHSDGGRAIVMGDFIGDSIYPEQYAGGLIFTDIGDQVLRVVNFDDAGNVDNVKVVSDPVGFLVDVQLHSDGFLYYVDITGNVGRLEFIVA